MKRHKFHLLLMMSLAFFIFTACQDNNRQNQTAGEEQDEMVSETGDQDRVDRDNLSTSIQGDEELSTFSMGVTRAHLTDDFREGEGPFTIFAPTNEAYEELSQEEREEIEANTDAAGASTNYLVVERNLPSSELRQAINQVGGNLELITRQGEKITATLEDDGIVLVDGQGNQARIVEADRETSNGTLHVIDEVLRPENIRRDDAALRNLNQTDTTGTNTTGANDQNF